MIEAAGGEGRFVRTDVSLEADVEALMETGVQAYGRLDCAVNNAGREAIVGVLDASEEDFAAEVGKQGIRVNEIAPALLMSDMVKQYFEGPNAASLDAVIARLALDHVGTPEDGARAILFLCSDAASYITGVTFPVDGGFLLYNAGS